MAINNPYGPKDDNFSGVTPNNPYGTRTPAPGSQVKAPKAPTVKAPSAPKTNVPEQEEKLAPIVGVGQGILKTLLTSGAGSVGALDAIWKNIAKGENNNPVESAGKNIAALWGSKDLFASGGWDGVKTGDTFFDENIAPEIGVATDARFQMPTEIFNLNAAVNPLYQIMGKLAPTVETEDGQSVKDFGETSAWLGFGIDVGTDPLSYGTKGLTQVIGAVAKGAAASSKAGKLAARGEVASALAASRAKSDAVTVNWGELGGILGQKRVPAKLQSIKTNILKVDPKATEKILQTKNKFANSQYKTTRIDAPRGVSEIVSDIVGSALDASRKSVTSSYAAINQTKFLERYAKRDITGSLQKTIKTKIQKDPDSSKFFVLSGNGVKLGEAATQAEAKTIASNIQQGIDQVESITPVAMVNGAIKTEATGTAPESVAITTKEGGTADLEIFTPHQADNGKFYVYDGDNVAELATLEEAEEFIDVFSSPARQNVEPIVTKQGRQYQVNVGEQVSKFKTKKEADAYAAAIRTGEVGGSRRMTSGGTPIVDSAPASISVTDALKIPSKKEASALKNVLKGIDEIAKKTSGWRSAVSENSVNAAKRILNKKQGQIDSFLMKAPDEALATVRAFLDDELPFEEMLNALRYGNTKSKVDLANVILKTTPVDTSKGMLSLEDALKIAKGKFLNLTKAVEGVEGYGLENQVRNYLLNNVTKRAELLKRGEIKPAYTEEGVYDALVLAVGEKNAKAIRATGYITERSEAKRSKLDTVFEGMKVNSDEVSYAGYDDLVAGVQRGDQVSEDALQQIFNTIDPNGTLIAKFEKQASESNADFLRFVFTRGGGVDTIEEAEKRLALAHDPEMLAKHTGLAYESEVAALIKLMDSENSAAAINALDSVSTQEAAANRFAARPQPARRDAADSLGRMFMLTSGDPVNPAGVIEMVRSVLGEPGGIKTVSSLNDEIVTNTTKAYSEGSRAAMSKQLQQSSEQRFISSVVAKLSFRGEKPTDKLTETIERLQAGNDYLNATGFRFVRTKNRNDSTFQKAYNKTLQTAKETNTTPNFSAFSEKHTVYLPMADILNILKTGGADKALIKGFFPSGPKVDFKRDSLDWISLGDASRRVLEMDAAGEVFDLGEIATRLLVKGKPQMPTKARVEKLKDVANEIAEKLTDPEIVAQLRAVHLDNAAAVVKDSAEKVGIFRQDLFDALDEAWVAMHLDNNLSEMARMDIIRRHFRRFVIAADILKLQDGPVAEIMFKASAQLFGDGGKVIPAGKVAANLNAKELEVYNLLRDGESKLFREALTRYYRSSDIPTVPPGREGVKLPSKAVKERAGVKLEEAMIAYRTHMDQLPTVEQMDDLVALKNWEKQQTKIKKKLDTARDDAWLKGVQTFHYDNGKWIESELFDRAKAVKEAEQIHTRYVAGKRGAADRAVYLADSTPTVPPHRKLSPSEKAKFLVKYRKDATQYQMDKATSIIDDAARNVADEVEAGILDELDLMPDEQMMLVAQNTFARALKEGMEIRISTQRASYGAVPARGTVEFNRKFRPLIDDSTPVFLADRTAAKFKQFSERWSGYGGRSDVGAILKQGENRSLTTSTDFAASLDKLQREFAKTGAEDFGKAWSTVRQGELLEDASDLAKALNPFVNEVFRGHARSVLTTESIDGQALAEAFSRFGLDRIDGMPSLKAMNGKTPEELVQYLFDELPFGEVPTAIKGTDKAVAWQQKAEAFKKAEFPPLLVFTRMMEAIQMVKQEKTVAMQFISQFGWKAHFKNAQEAVADGWVQVAAEGKQNIARFLPDAEGGNLVHPDIAEQMGSVFREYNNNFAESKFPNFLNGLMRAMGVIKFTQTTLMPRHHVTNGFGDSTTAFIAGTRNPMDWGDGFRIANNYTARNLKADWGNNFQAQADRLTAAFRDQPGAQPPTPNTSNSASLKFYVDGKPTAKEVDFDELANEFGERGIMPPGFVISDIQGFANDTYLYGATAGTKKAFSKSWGKITRSGRNIMKGFSDFTAAYSNGIRAAHAMMVARSRVWSSKEEMYNAITKQINLYHPTIQSLGSTERRWGRLTFTYYTWLRVAHSAMIDMAINHTASMLAVPKLMYANSVSQGFKPESAAVPFEDNSMLPDYLAYSIYGPNSMNEQGPRTYRPPFLPLDVLDFWRVYYDPSKTLSQNVPQMLGQTGELLGGAFNLFGKPLLAASQGARPPGDLGELGEDALSNLGFMSLLTGLGAYTPYRYKNPDTTNPLTDADRRRLLENSFSGMRSVDINRPVNVKIGQSQQKSRTRQYNENMQKENLKKVQSFVDDRLSEGYTKEQIIEMLKQLGVK